MAERGMAVKIGGKYFELVKDRSDRSCNSCAFYKYDFNVSDSICIVGFLNLSLICSTWDEPYRMKFKEVEQ